MRGNGGAGEAEEKPTDRGRGGTRRGRGQRDKLEEHRAGGCIVDGVLPQEARVDVVAARNGCELLKHANNIGGANHCSQVTVRERESNNLARRGQLQWH